MSVHEVHCESLEISTTITTWYVPEFVKPLDVARVLNKAGVPFLFIGTHAYGGWMREPRASADVDTLVAARRRRKAVLSLVAAFPQLTPEEEGAVTRLRHRQTRRALIDVWTPGRPLYREALKHTLQVRCGVQRYRIPSLEMALAMTFVPMVSLPDGNANKYLLAHDFILMALANLDIDDGQLLVLGERAFPGGGEQLVGAVNHVRSGEELHLERFNGPAVPGQNRTARPLTDEEAHG
jgi:hypothetical protein